MPGPNKELMGINRQTGSPGEKGMRIIKQKGRVLRGWPLGDWEKDLAW